MEAVSRLLILLITMMKLDIVVLTGVSSKAAINSSLGEQLNIHYLEMDVHVMRALLAQASAPRRSKASKYTLLGPQCLCIPL
jgi:hypothetical protein